VHKQPEDILEMHKQVKRIPECKWKFKTYITLFQHLNNSRDEQPEASLKSLTLYINRKFLKYGLQMKYGSLKPCQ